MSSLSLTTTKLDKSKFYTLLIFINLIKYILIYIYIYIVINNNSL